MRRVIVATRAGDLAIKQANIVISEIEKQGDFNCEIQTVTTAGDTDRKTPLWNLEKDGFFTSAIEHQLLEEKVDIAVHSLKDLPILFDDRLVVAAVFDRRFIGDCLIGPQQNTIKSIADLKVNAKIGTSSIRRTVQLKKLRSDFDVQSIRGNVTTRIQKLDRGDYDAIVLAKAGLIRLGLIDRISFCFDVDSFLPAAAQGAIAVQVRKNDTEMLELVSKINDKTNNVTATAERLVLAKTGLGCRGPIGVVAEIVDKNQLSIRAFVADEKAEQFIYEKVCGKFSEYQKLAEKLANKLLNGGAARLLGQEQT